MAHLIRDCTTCGKKIVFRQNSEGKYIPFDYLTDRCHFETCTKKPNTFFALPQEFKKSSIPYEEQIKNKKLDIFI